MVKANDLPPIPDSHPHAYPVTPAPVYKIPMTQPNIDLRDWFAGMAMQAWISSYTEDQPHPVVADAEECVAKLSYGMADAMLKVREAK